MTWPSDLSRQLRHRLALEVLVAADNARIVADQLDKIAGELPDDDTSTILELHAASSLQRTIWRSLDSKAQALSRSLDPIEEQRQ